MVKMIEFYENENSLNKTILPYSDEVLIEMVKKRVNKINAIGISLKFFDRDCNFGGVMVTIYNSIPIKFGNVEVLSLHNIVLNEETYHDCVKECQREKNLLKNHFKNLNVTSDFR